MKIIYISLILSLSILSCSNKDITPIELANKMVKIYGDKTSLSYEINYQIKYFSEVDDTTKISSKIDLVRVPADSVFGGYVWINSDSIERYYDTNFLYFINHNEKSITRYPKEKPYIITGNTVGEAIRIYFLDPQRLINGVTDSTINVELINDELLGKKVLKLSYKFPDDEYTKNSWKNIWIDKDDFSIPKMNYSADMQGENQYNQWDIFNITYDQVNSDDLEGRFSKLKEKYQISDYEERSKEESVPLANGTSFPNINGINYSDNSQINLSEISSYLTLFDFWYMDCFPCIKAIPHLNEIHNKYKDKGFKVVGLNPFNNNVKDMKRFPNFLENNTIDYPIIFIDREDSKKFNVGAYPTFYLIDKNGKVLYSQVGYSQESTEKIDSLILVNL